MKTVEVKIPVISFEWFTRLPKRWRLAILTGTPIVIACLLSGFFLYIAAPHSEILAGESIVEMGDNILIWQASTF